MTGEPRNDTDQEGVGDGEERAACPPPCCPAPRQRRPIGLVSSSATARANVPSGSGAVGVGTSLSPGAARVVPATASCLQVVRPLGLANDGLICSIITRKVSGAFLRVCFRMCSRNLVSDFSRRTAYRLSGVDRLWRLDAGR
jgi:hypothetical protein